MKRKVRVTPPASNPFESNPMSTWMAQMGGAQPTQDEHITSIAAEMLSQGFEDEEVKQILANQGFPLAKVNEIIDALYAYVDEQRDLSEANYLEDELAQEQILAEQEAAEMEASEEDAYSNDMYYAPDSDPGYAEEDAAMQEILMRSGGRVPSKKQFVKQALKLKKKQEGGDEASNKADDTMAEKRPINNFIQKLTQTAQQKADEEALEQQYDQMFGDQELPEAQFGGFRNPRRAERRMNRQVNRMIRNTPMGFFNPSMQFLPSQMNFMTAPMMYPQGFGMQGMMNPGVQMANIQVTRTGLFGRPKEYTINFATTPPNQINPREVIEQEIRNTGETVKEQQQEQKEKEVSTASEDNKNVQEELITADQIEVVGAKPSGGNKGNTTQNSTPQAKSTVKRDAWGRPEGDKWFGYDPNSNKIDQAKPAVKKDKWGRPEGSKWYGYDPDKNKKSSYLSYVPQGVLKAADTVIGETNTFVDQVRRAFQQQGGVTGYDLYKFTGGGDEPMMPFADESFRTYSKDATDPYFREGGLTKYQTKGQTKDAWNRSQGTIIEFPYDGMNDVWDGEKWVGSTDSETNTEPVRDNLTPRPGEPGYEEYIQERNRKKYDALKELGYNVGDYREGIDYSKLTNFPQTAKNQTKVENFPMYPGQAGYPMMGPAGVPIYPPLFNNRGGRGRGMFGPGRSIQYAGSWLQQQGLPYDPRTGQPIQGIAAPQIKSIDVKKSGLISGRPKKYTINFVGQAPEGTGFGTFNTGFQPRKDWNTPYTPQMTGTQSSGSAYWDMRDKAFQKRIQKKARKKGYDIAPDEENVNIDYKDLQTVGKLPIKPAESIFTSADELKARQEAQLEGAPAQLPIRRPAPLTTAADQPKEIIERNFPTNVSVPRPELSEEQLAELEPGIIDVQAEDLSQEYTPLPSEVAANRDPQVISPIVDMSGPRADMNYSYDFPGEGENYPEEYQIPYSPERNYMLESLGRGSSNNPFLPIGADAPLIGPEAAAQYLNERLNYNTDLPYQSQLPEELVTQEMLSASQQRAQERAAREKAARERAIKEQIARGEKNVQKGTKQEVKQIAEEQKKKTKEQIEEEEIIKEFFPSWEEEYAAMSPLEKLKYNYDKINAQVMATPEMQKKVEDFKFKEAVGATGIKEFKKYKSEEDLFRAIFNDQDDNSLLFESLYTYTADPKERTARQILKQKYDNWQSKIQWDNPEFFKKNKLKFPDQYQTGGANMSYPMMPKAQTMGQFNMSTPYERKNYAIMPSAEEMMQKQTPMGQFADYRNPLTGAAPAIRMGSDGEYINEGVLTDEDLAKLNQREMSVDAKVKNMYNVDFENLVNQFNAATGLGLSMFGQVGDIAKNQQAMANLTAGNVYGSKNQLNQGDWTQWGQLRPNMQAFKQEGMTTRSQKGGSTYKEGGTHYMSSKQIAEFLANGGEIEFV